MLLYGEGSAGLGPNRGFLRTRPLSACCAQLSGRLTAPSSRVRRALHEITIGGDPLSSTPFYIPKMVRPRNRTESLVSSWTPNRRLRTDGGDRKRSDDGTFSEEVTSTTILDFVRSHDEPTTGDIANAFPITRQAMLVRLKKLEEDGQVTSRMRGNAHLWSVR